MISLTGLPAVSTPLPWQGEAWSRFNQQLQEQTLPHALLLTGLQHSGKARLALALSRLLLCQQPVDGLNCGQCHSCELSASGSHGDWRWLQPEEKSRVIKIDPVREVVSFATRTAGFGLRKVVVISPAENMNTNAANALLKSLEEPSADTFLILVCHQLHGIPATLRSRCQIVKLPNPSAEQSLNWLEQVTGGTRQESQQLLDSCEGMPLLAQQLYHQPDASDQMAVRTVLRGIAQGSISMTEAVPVLTEGQVEDVLDQLTMSLQRHLKRLDAATLRSSGKAWFALLDEIGGIRRSVSGGANPNRQLLAEVLLGKVQVLLGSARANDNIS